jgi:hypothetical protein
MDVCVNLFFTGDLAEDSFGPPQYSEESLIAASFHQVKNRCAISIVIFTKNVRKTKFNEEVRVPKD